ncbi:MAG: adenylate/guanylate cyclase domain-containing protein [Alphaproteobacteria bacterium]|nr:MAG: adenylate/guanylate cyclase domain-containing protein [Alphaproteobacteria bacterium]
MSAERVERRLAAILAADVAGYSRLMGRDEAGTLARLKALRRELIDPMVAEHKGRIVKTTGDGLLIEFPSVVEAVACAITVQSGMGSRNAATPEDRRIEFRVGINSGDIIVEDGDIHGDGVNIAARLEGVAEPGGICVSAIVHDQVRDRLDCVFEDLGEQSLKNIVRPVRVYRIGPEIGPRAFRPLSGVDATGTAAVQPAALPLPDKPSIAVLPFQNMSGDPEQEYFVDGMVEEIITALSRIRWLFVIARNSTFTYKGRPIEVKEIGRELGVRYILEGSVRKGGSRVRITAQLIDAETGAHLWADRFDGLIEDVFELQDKIALSVAGVIEPALQAAEMRRSAARPTTDLTAYDLYLRALAVFYPITKERVIEALRLFEEAIAIDPHYGPALSWAAMCHREIATSGWAEAPETSWRKGSALARQAVQAAENDPRVLVNAALVLAHFGDDIGEDIGAMIGLIDRALALNPSFARGWNVSGILRNIAGEHDLAIEHIGIALRLSPRERIGTPLVVLGMAYFLKRQFDEAASKLLLAVQDNPGHPGTYRCLAACYAHMGRLDEAHEIVTRLRAITPIIVPSDVPYRNLEYRELLLSGLRLAMGES